MAYEKVTLFGLPVVQRRRVRLGPIDPETARALLICHGLVEGQVKTPLGFLRHNLGLAAEIEATATKSRRSDLFVDEQRLIDFYESRVPPDVTDVAALQRWLRTSGGQRDGVLQMTREDLVGQADLGGTADHFPNDLDVGPARLPLEYRFEPGSDQDGVTVTVPQAALNQLHDGRLGWLVPGLLEDKVLALIRSLPKSVRRNFVPAPDTARRVVQEIHFGQGPFLQAVADTLRRVGGEPVSPRDFQLDKLPQHLQMNVRVVDEQGQELASARNLDQLQREFRGVAAGPPVVMPDSRWHRDGITAWDFGDLPESIEVTPGGIPLTVHPMLLDQQTFVALRLTDNARIAARQTRCAVRRLCCLAVPRELRSQVAWLPRLEQMKLYAATLCTSGQLEQQLAELLAERAFLDQDLLPRTADEFAQLLDRGQHRMGTAVDQVARFVQPLLEVYHRARLGLEQATSPNWQYAVDDMWEQLRALTPVDFLASTPWAWLQHCPRYLEAIVVRLAKLAGSGWQRDQRSYEQIAPFWQAYRQYTAERDQRAVDDPALEQFRWMLEEFRVSLFAQELRTAMPVSAKRLERQWQQVTG
jgi:ATP-dependent helicase HrpA